MKEKEEEMNDYQKILRSWAPPEGKSTDQAWSELESKLDKRPLSTGKVVSMRRTWIGVAAAAVVVIAVVMVWPKSRTIREASGMAEMKTVTLPDGSTVLLNAASSVEFSDDWSDRRFVSLQGQGFFEVKKGSRFVVETPQGAVEVLGTSFDVNAHDGGFVVDCETGKVQVTSGTEKQIITPGLRSSLTNGRLEVSTFEVNANDWKDGVYDFDRVDIKVILHEIERQFNIRIDASELDGISASHFEFSKEDSWQITLENLLKIYSCDFREEGGKIIVFKK